MLLEVYNKQYTRKLSEFVININKYYYCIHFYGLPMLVCLRNMVAFVAFVYALVRIDLKRVLPNQSIDGRME